MLVCVKELCVCVTSGRLIMNRGEDASGTVTLESVNSVTLTQDTDGNIILHCPHNGQQTHSMPLADVLSYPSRNPIIIVMIRQPPQRMNIFAHNI